MGDYFDFRVHDLVALDEIELYAEVLSAVAAADRPLTVAELDQVLGVQPCRRRVGLQQLTARTPEPSPGSPSPPGPGEHHVGVPAGKAERLVQPDRRRVVARRRTA